MLCNVDTGYKNGGVGYILIIQFSPFSNDYANNQPWEHYFTSSTLPTITELIIIIVLFIEFH